VAVEEIDAKILSRIDDKKRALQRINEKSASLKRAKKEAYFHHIYHTVGIEGNTMTLSQTRCQSRQLKATGVMNLNLKFLLLKFGVFVSPHINLKEKRALDCNM
jgi:hypothetical protein